MNAHIHAHTLTCIRTQAHSIFLKKDTNMETEIERERYSKQEGKMEAIDT